ncbi:Rne/Rng family ribonuclease [Kribbella italica]|uniref:Ribonuclease E n=1 Tax=Kribbella italica TaxID=1540520 RepID=A0A7W9MS69_9ACTN|nr:Rne/Rng family ribonuclease [Kribbella italica]MBB5833598.1 ribonuclease E [Kribbella italica]
MLDNEPNTTEADDSAPTQPARKAGTKKTAAKKTTAKTATTRKRTVKKTAAPAEVSTQSDAESADPAPAPVKKAAARKTAAKAPAKKAAAKRTVKKAAAAPAEDTSTSDAGPVVETPAPAKKTTRRRTTKKATAPQPDLLTPDSPLTDGPVADAEEDEETLAAEAATSAQSGTSASNATGAAAASATGDVSGAGQASGTTAETAPKSVTTTQAGTTQSGTGRGRSARSGATSAQSGNTASDTTGAAAASATGDVSGAGQASRTTAETAPKSVTTTGTSYVTVGGGTPAATEEPEAPAEETPQRRSRRRAPVAAPLFQAPVEVAPQAAATSPVEATPETTDTPRKRTRSRRGAAAEVDVQTEQPTDVPAETAEIEEQPTARRRRSRRGKDAEELAEATTEAAEEITADDAADDDAEEDGEGTRRRRRRRGGRRRRKSGEGADDNADSDEDDTDDEQSAEADTEDDGEQSDDEGSGSSSRRRRRRRRRKGEEGSGAADDPDETVVRVREPRSKNTANEITAVEGSTRLEAKKQRRREGRAAGRRRAPIVTEAEFLARRESVERAMVIRARGDLTQIAVSEDNVLVEHYVAQEEQVSLIGNVYLGRVQNVLPSMEAAFIDIGKGRNAVLYAGEVDWATLGGGNGPRKIESVLKSGQAVLVQVTKDPIGHKGARLTNQISLPGRYVVYVPRGGNGGISRKLPDTERNRLKTILKDIVPDEAGVIVRTAAEGATEEELTADVSRLQSYWTEIDKLSKSGQAPQLLHGEPDLLIRVVRDLFTEDFTKLVISGDDAFDQVSEYVSSVAPHLADRVEKWTGDNDVFANFRIDEQIKKALDRKVWLPSGGSLIIDRTEAMTVVDVNTGKFTGSGGNLEETVTKNNLEAAEEIVRQLRLRDIGGIIVIDFIDMVLESNRDLVLRRLVECLGRDRTKHQVAEVTSLGLVQMTRKRIGTGLLEAFSENCDHCGGRGLILHDEPKESRRGGGRGQQQEQKNGHDHGKASSDGEGRKSSRRNRGKGRRDDEQTETADAAPHNGDAAQRLAQIAAASAAANGHDEAPAPDSGPAADSGSEERVNDVQDVAAEAPAEASESSDNGSTRTRRRRSSRSRSKSADSDADTAQELVTTAP